jgi:hypothetical protein
MVTYLEIPVTTLPQPFSNHLERLAGGIIRWAILPKLPALRADLNPGSNKPDLSKQVAFDHERVEAPGPLFRIDPM